MKEVSHLIHLVKRGELDLYKKIIGKFDINIRNDWGQSLLHKAVANGHTEIALDLLGRSIDVNLQDEKGMSALHYLGIYPNNLLAKKIIEKGGNIELKDFYGNTPLWYGVFNAKGKYDFVELLVGYGANLNSKNSAGKSPMDFAKQIKDDKLVAVLHGS